MKNYLQEGKLLNVTVAADGASGALLVIGDMPCVAQSAHTAGETIPAAVEGCFELPKVAGAVAQGQTLYALAAGGSVTTDSNGGANPKCGFAVAAAAGGAATVPVKFAI